MRIGGLQKFSLIDYPGKVACIIFTLGCNFRCGYCHNPELVIPECFGPEIPEERVLDLLKSRQNYLQGVVVSGGEPTIHADLAFFLKKIKLMGYAVKLDTNGSQPEHLKALLSANLVDYIAMDVKTSYKHYDKAAGVPVDIKKIHDSIDLIIDSGIAHEFRTTVVKPVCSREDLCDITGMIVGAQRYRLQNVRIKEKMLDPDLRMKEQFSDEEFCGLKQCFENNP